MHYFPLQDDLLSSNHNVAPLCSQETNAIYHRQSKQLQTSHRSLAVKLLRFFLSLWVTSLVIIWRKSAFVGRSTTVPFKLSLSERRIIKFSSCSLLDILLSLNKSGPAVISGLWAWQKYASSAFTIKPWLSGLARRMVYSSSADTQGPW